MKYQVFCHAYTIPLNIIEAVKPTAPPNTKQLSTDPVFDIIKPEKNTNKVIRRLTFLRDIYIKCLWVIFSQRAHTTYTRKKVSVLWLLSFFVKCITDQYSRRSFNHIFTDLNPWSTKLYHSNIHGIIHPHEVIHHNETHNFKRVKISHIVQFQTKHLFANLYV